MRLPRMHVWHCEHMYLSMLSTSCIAAMVLCIVPMITAGMCAQEKYLIPGERGLGRTGETSSYSCHRPPKRPPAHRPAQPSDTRHTFLLAPQQSACHAVLLHPSMFICHLLVCCAAYWQTLEQGSAQTSRMRFCLQCSLAAAAQIFCRCVCLRASFVPCTFNHSLPAKHSAHETLAGAAGKIV